MHDRAVFGPLRLGMENGAGVQTETVFSRTTLGQTRSKIREDAKRLYRSALQTHLQGVDGATLAVVPEKSHHNAALLSQSSCAECLPSTRAVFDGVTAAECDPTRLSALDAKLQRFWWGLRCARRRRSAILLPGVRSARWNGGLIPTFLPLRLAPRSAKRRRDFPLPEAVIGRCPRSLPSFLIVGRRRERFPVTRARAQTSVPVEAKWHAS